MTGNLGRYFGLSTAALVFAAAGLMGFQNAASQTSPPPTPSQSSGQAAPEPDHAGSYYHFMLARRYQELAGIYSRADFVDKAVREYQEAIADNPGSQFLKIELAKLYWRVSRVGDAVKEAQEVLSSNPNNLEAHKLLGNIYLRNLGDNQTAVKAKDSLNKAIEQYEIITQLNPKDVDSLVLLGRLYGLDKQTAKAEAVFKKALEAQPQSHGAAAYLARVYMDQGDFHRALDVLKRIPASQLDLDSLAMMGQAYSELQQYDDARKCYRAALDQDPANQDLRRAYADALMHSGKTEKAHAQFERLVRDNPQDSVSYLRLAQIDQSEGHFNAAKKELAKAKTLAPGDLEVGYQQALYDDATGDDAAAIQILQGLLKRTGGDAPASIAAENNNKAILLERLGVIYRSQEQYNQAMEEFQKIVALGPSQAPRGESLIIETLRLQKSPKKALEEANRAVKQFPNDRSLAILRASLMGEQGHVNQAVTLLRELSKGQTKDPGIELAIAQVYLTAKKYDQAQSTVEGLLQQKNLDSSNREYAEFLLGSIYERQKNIDGAEDQFRKVLATDPLNSEAANYLGYILADRGIDLDESVKYIQQALKLQPNNAAYLDSLGWAYYKMKRYDLAQPPLEKAASLLSSDPTVLDHLGHLYLAMGKKKEAAQEWERALKEWPKAVDSDFDAKQAAKLAKQLKTLKRHLASSD
jgi:tetratricopeptide (TPR) repeat protein